MLLLRFVYGGVGPLEWWERSGIFHVNWQWVEYDYWSISKHTFSWLQVVTDDK